MHDCVETRVEEMYMYIAYYVCMEIYGALEKREKNGPKVAK
jgi:hypothetical protein